MRTRCRPIGRIVLMALALCGMLSPVSSLALPQPAPRSVTEPLELIPQAYLPILMIPEAPVVPDIAIYDMSGAPQDWDWLVATFGAVALEPGTGAAQVVELREAGPYVTLIVHVENANGDPIMNQEVVFYWPDAGALPAEKQACGLDRGLVVLTKENGNAEFAMGLGSEYVPAPDAAGPHVVWVVREGTDCLYGLGWLEGTDHTHLDSVWVLP